MLIKEREARRIYIRKLHARKRIKLINLLGGKCIKCGSIENLEFDHIDHSKKIFTINVSRYSWKDILKEAEKCQILCHECHKQKNKIDGSTFKNNIKGEQVWNSKLTEKEVKEIRTKLLDPKVVILHLAKDHHVDEKLIRLIRDNKIWKHVKL